MTKEEWIDRWIDKYLETATEKVTDFDALREKADCAYYDEQIEKGLATEYDLTKEQEKISKQARQGKAVDAYGKERKRTKKEDPEKRAIIARIAEALDGDWTVNISNPERQIDFGSYSLTLTKHRPPKG